ncbi:hypothetical protein H4R26_003312, partial [Coemansia thaxteri]
MVELDAAQQPLPLGQQDTAEDKANLWETALKEVGSSKAVATKHVLVLGDPNSGKTAVVAQLFSASFNPQVGNGLNAAATMTHSAGLRSHAAAEADSVVTLSKHDMALTYSYMDVRDEDNEETVARLGIYQLASDRASDRELLKLVLDARSFATSAAVIVLDWSRPWRFVKTLLRWVNVLSGAVDMVCSDTAGRESTSSKSASGWTLGKATVDECCERLERFLQEYSEAADHHAAADASTANGTAASTAMGGTRGIGGTASADFAAKTAGVLLPLGQGVLGTNLGIPLIVVCTKSDTMDQMERERGFKEEDFDYIQQVLRAVCLQFGAALIYTSTHNPATFSTLYHYLVHRLLTTPVTLPALPDGNGEMPAADDTDESMTRNDMTSAGSEGKLGSGPQLTMAYQFRVRANVVDRDVVFVPAGWDSVAKISYLREPFDVHAVQDAWKADEERYQAIVDRAIRESIVAPSASGGLQEVPEKVHPNKSLLHIFGEAVTAPKHRSGMDADGSSTAAAVAAAAAGLASHVAVEDDQVFFERLFIEQQEQMALDGEMSGDSGAHQSDVYTDGRGRLGVATSRLLSGLVRGGQNAEPSMSASNDGADISYGDTLSDDDADDLDRASASSLAVESRPPLAMQPAALSPLTHARSESSDATFSRSQSRVASGGRAGRPTPLAQSSTTAEAAPSASSLRRKLTMPTGS